MSLVSSYTSVEKALEVLHNIGKATQGADVLDPKSLRLLLQIVNNFCKKNPRPLSLLVPLAHCAGNMLFTTKDKDSVLTHVELIASVLVNCLKAVETASRNVAEEEMTKSEIIRRLTEEYQTMLTNHPKRKYFLLERLFEPLAKLINSHQLSASEVSNVAKLLNMMMSGVRRNFRTELFKKNKNAVEAFVTRMITCGDYEAQQDILEILVRLSCEGKENAAKEWFYRPVLIASFMDIGTKQFELECRSFINLMNSLAGDNCSVFTFPCEVIQVGNVKVYKPESDIVTDLFVDCNMGSKSLSFSFVRRPLQFDLETNQLRNAICPASLTHRACLLAVNEKLLQLTLTLETVIPGLDDTDLAEFRSCTMLFKRKHLDLPMLLYSIFGNILECDPEAQMMIQQQIPRSDHRGKFKKASDGVILMNTHKSDGVECMELSDEEIQSNDTESANCHGVPNARSPPPLLSRDPANCDACDDISDQDDSNAEENACDDPTLDTMKEVKSADNTKKTDDFSSLIKEKKVEDIIPKETLMMQQTPHSPILTGKKVKLQRKMMQLASMQDTPSHCSSAKSALMGVSLSGTSGASNKKLQSKEEPVAQENVDVLTTASSMAATPKKVVKSTIELPCSEKAAKPSSESDKVKTKAAISKQNKKNIKTTETSVIAMPKKEEKPVEEEPHLEKAAKPSSEPDKVKTKAATSKQNKKNVEVKITETLVTAMLENAEQPVEEEPHLLKEVKPSSEPDKVKTKTAISKQKKKNVEVKPTETLVTRTVKKEEQPVEEVSHLKKIAQTSSEPNKATAKAAIYKQNKKKVEVKTTETLVTVTIKKEETPVEEEPHLERAAKPISEPNKATAKAAISKQNKKNVEAKAAESLVTTMLENTGQPVEEEYHLEKAAKPSSEPDKVKTKTAISKQNKKKVQTTETSVTALLENAEQPVEEEPHLEKAAKPNSEPDKVKTKTAISKQNKKNVDAKITELKETKKIVEELSHLEKTDQPKSEPEKIKTKAEFSKQNISPSVMPCKTTRVEEPVDKSLTLVPFCKAIQAIASPLEADPRTYPEETSNHPLKVAELPGAASANPSLFEDPVPSKMRLRRRTKNKGMQLQLPHLQFIEDKNSSITPAGSRKRKLFTPGNKLCDSPMPEGAKKSRNETKESPTFAKQKNENFCTMQINQSMTVKSLLQIAINFNSDTEDCNYSAAHTVFSDTEELDRQDEIAEWSKQKPFKSYGKNAAASKKKEMVKSIQNNCDVASVANSIEPINCSKDTKDYNYSAHAVFSDTKELDKQVEIAEWLKPKTFKSYGKNVAALKKRDTAKSMQKNCETPLAANSMDCKPTSTVITSCNQVVINTTSIDATIATKVNEKVSNKCKNGRQKQNEGGKIVRRLQQKQTTRKNNKPTTAEMCSDTSKHETIQSLCALWSNDYLESLPELVVEKPEEPQPLVKPLTPKFLKLKPMCYDPVATDSKTSNVKAEVKKCIQFDEDNNEAFNIDYSKDGTMLHVDSPSVQSSPSIIPDSQHQAETWDGSACGKNENKLQNTKKTREVAPEPQKKSDDNNPVRIRSGGNSTIQSSQDSVWDVPSKVHAKGKQPKSKKTGAQVLDTEKSINPKISEKSTKSVTEKSSIPATESTLNVEVIIGKKKNVLKSKPLSLSLAKIKKTTARGKKNATASCTEPLDEESWLENSDQALFSDLQHNKIKTSTQNGKNENTKVSKTSKHEPAKEGNKIAVDKTSKKSKKVSAMNIDNTESTKANKPSKHEPEKEGNMTAVDKTIKNSKKESEMDTDNTESTKAIKPSKEDPAKEGNMTVVEKTIKNSKKKSEMDTGNTESTKTNKASKQEPAKKGNLTEVEKTSKSSKKESAKDTKKTTVGKVKENKDMYQPKDTTKPSTKVVAEEANEKQVQSLPVKPAAVKATKKTIKAKEKCNPPSTKAKSNKPNSRSAEKQKAGVNSRVVSKPTSNSKQGPKTRKKMAVKPIDELEYPSSIEEEVSKESETTENVVYSEDIELMSKADKKSKPPAPTKISKKDPVKQQKVRKDTKKIKPTKEIKEDKELNYFPISVAKCHKQEKKLQQVSEKQTETARKRKAEPVSSSKSKVAVAKDSHVQKKSTGLKIIPESSSVETSPSIIECTPESTFVETPHVSRNQDQAKYHSSSRLNTGKLSHSGIAEELVQTTPVSSPESSPTRSEGNFNASGLAVSPAFHSTPKKMNLPNRYPTSESEEVETPPTVRRKLRRRSLLPSFSAAKKRQQKLSENNPSTSSEDESTTEEPPVKRPTLDSLKSLSKDIAGESVDNLHVSLETSATFNNSVMNSGRYFENVIKLAEKWAANLVKESIAARQENLRQFLRKLEEEMLKCEERRAELEAVQKRQEKMLHYAYNTFEALYGIMDTPPASMVSKKIQERPEVNLFEQLGDDLNKIGEDYQRQELRSTMMEMQSKLQFLLL